MRSHTPFIAAISALALAAGLTAIGAPAFAKRGDSARRADDVLEQVTVVGQRTLPMVVKQTVVTGYGIKHYDLMTLTHHISYADLDLAQPAGGKTLEHRIRVTADRLCERLANTPPAEPRSMQCVHEAVQSAMKQARMAIAAAKK